MQYALLIYDENTANPSPEPPDPAVYDRLCKETEDDQKKTPEKDCHNNTEENSHGPT